MSTCQIQYIQCAVNVLFSFYSLDVIKPPEDTGLIPSASTTCPPGLHNRRFRE